MLSNHSSATPSKGSGAPRPEAMASPTGPDARVQLHVAADAEHRSERGRQRPVHLSPVAVELGLVDVRAAVQAEHELDHAPRLPRRRGGSPARPPSVPGFAMDDVPGAMARITRHNGPCRQRQSEEPSSLRAGRIGTKAAVPRQTGATVANAAPLLTTFGGAFDVVAFDQRGIGRSALPDGAYTMADLAQDAFALADHLEWEHFRLAGVSFGGMVAQEVAVTAARPRGPPGAPVHVARRGRRCVLPLGLVGRDRPGRACPSTVQILDTRFTTDWLESHEGDRALVSVLLQRVTAPKSAEARRGEEMQLGARRGHDVYDRLPGITCPTLVASGRYDGIAPVANGAAIVHQIPNATLRVFEGGHLFFVQDPLAFPEILTFHRGETA